MNTDDQLLKSRDDKAPVLFSRTPATTGTEESFQLVEKTECSWAPKDEPFSTTLLRSRIEPWLTALFQSEHLALLVGSGLPHALHRMATNNALPGMNTAQFTHYDAEINEAAKTSARAAGRENGNIEDQIRVANELLRGLQILERGTTTAPPNAAGLKDDIKRILETFATNILAGEHGLITATTADRETACNYLVSFLMSFASRTGTRDRLQVFTTNYDRYIEVGAEFAGLHLLDRFVGSIAPIFRSSRLDVDMHYNPPGIRGEPRYLEGVAKFTKLHGSIDWVSADRNIRRLGVPFGTLNIEPYLNAPGLAGTTALELMIYPNAAKDRETAAYPYVELFRDFAAAVCRPNSTLIAYGYSLGDEHINRVIEDMLTIPSTHLVIISYDDPLGRITKMYEKLGRHAQITMLIGNHLGAFQPLVDNYLPKPAIDRTTFRMAELLKARWNTGPAEHATRHDDTEGTEQ